MSKRLSLSAAVLLTAAITMAFPAFAQIPAPPPPPVPDLHVRIVTAAPPPPRHEVIVYRERPAVDYVWVKGFYDWRGDDWVWVPGHWIAPPEHSVRWISPRYVRMDEGWRYEPAHWSNQTLIVDEKVKVKKVKVKKPKKEKPPKIKD
jgi:YXWGXW repeat-containing protein